MEAAEKRIIEEKNLRIQEETKRLAEEQKTKEKVNIHPNISYMHIVFQCLNLISDTIQWCQS